MGDEGNQVCGTCNGVGEISVKKIRIKRNPQTGQDEQFIYYDSVTCPTCKGKKFIPGRTR